MPAKLPVIVTAHKPRPHVPAKAARTSPALPDRIVVAQKGDPSATSRAVGTGLCRSSGMVGAADRATPRIMKSKAEPCRAKATAMAEGRRQHGQGRDDLGTEMA
jgi:hypothetical protein